MTDDKWVRERVGEDVCEIVCEVVVRARVYGKMEERGCVCGWVGGGGEGDT